MIRKYHTVDDYWRDTEEFLLQNIIQNNLIIGLVNSISDRNKLLEDTLLLNVFRDDKVILTLFKNRPSIIICANPSYKTEDVEILITYLRELRLDIRGLNAKKQLAIDFSKQFYPNYQIRRTLIVHKLTNINTVPLSDGEMSLCNQNDLELATNWLFQFQIECDLPFPMDIDKIRIDTKQRIERKILYKWTVHDIPVSICANMLQNQYLAKISLVFTPEDYRKKNYARSCVWSLAKYLFEQGQKNICLFTDASNPTSNKIYREIGFEPICEDYEIRYE